jgi:hypothetical protein
MSETTLPSVIEHMLQPEFYPHPVQQSIKLMQTHASFVLLTGDYAYKVKKNVDFGFLDYSTLEKRHHFCKEELRMNRQIAPQVYLDVVAIASLGDRYQLDGKGDIVEYAVKMVQFPQDALFINLFERGALTEQHMEDLGRVVANFHAETRTDDKIRSYGTVSQIRKAIDENYQQTESYIGGPQTQTQFQETKAFSDRFFDRRPSLFQQRIEGDRIRECHGDLHLKNIALWPDKIFLFDRIEFNKTFRFVDVMYDIGFAVMDIDSRGRPDLANAFLNTYIEHTGDWSGLQVLPLYLSRQAYVRAKVTSFLLDDPNISDERKHNAQSTAANYYQQAWKYTQQQQGRLILMSGLSGSGKTTLARRLARRINAIHIRSDVVRKHLAGIPLHQRGGDEIYTAEMTQKTYGKLLELGLILAREGYAVILDAKYDRQGLRADAIAAAEKQGFNLKILHCCAPMPVLRERLNQRSSQAVSDATANLLESQQAAAEPFTEAERVYVQTIDSTQSLESQLQQLKV